MEREIEIKFYSENFYRFDSFDPKVLMKEKERQGLKVSVVVPTLNEERTVGNLLDLIQVVANNYRLIDQLVVIDSGSIDNTQRVVESRGVSFYQARDILPQLPVASGKGENLWRSLFVTNGDIIVFLDADPQNPQLGYLYGLLGPLIMRPEKYLFVKSVFSRKTKGGNRDGLLTEGGRVTEIFIRPMIQWLFPALQSIVQPINGNIAGMRYILEDLEFPTGYGVDLSILLDIVYKFGIDKIAQVYCGEFRQDGQDNRCLGRMAYIYLNTMVRKAQEMGRLSNDCNVNETFFQPTINKGGDIFFEKFPYSEVIRPPKKIIETK